MAIQLASWADFGFRKLGPLPTIGGSSPADIADRLRRTTDYQFTPEHWIRRPERRKGAQPPESIRIAGVIENNGPIDEEQLSFLERFADSQWERLSASPTQVRTEFSDVIRLIQDAETAEKRCRAFYFLSSALSFADPEFLRPILRNHLLPCFFRLYPKGKVVFIQYDTQVDIFASAFRSLYGMAQAPLSELMGATHGISALREWHMVSLPHVFPALLDFFNYLFYPFVGGARAIRPGMAILFLFDAPEEHLPGPFPRNWLAFPSTSATFADESVSLVDLVAEPKGRASQRAGHQRFCHQSLFGVDDRLKLFDWYIERLNRFYFELTDAANFTVGLLPDAEIDPVFGYEHQISVDRLFRKTLLAMSLDVAPTANLMSFEIADLYDTLRSRFRNKNSDAEFFKLLFNTEKAPAFIKSHTAGMPHPFAAYFAETADRVYRAIEETVARSIWREGKVTPSGVLVRSRDLLSESPMPMPQFVAETMRAYRNAHHGYFTAGDSGNRPSRYLFMVDGNLPVEMSALPVLWWLAYLANPQFVGWNQLPLAEFD